MKKKPKKKFRQLAAVPRILRHASTVQSPLVELAQRITHEALALAEEEANSLAEIEAVDRVRTFMRDRIGGTPAEIRPDDQQLVIALLKTAIDGGHDDEQLAAITLVALARVKAAVPAARAAQHSTFVACGPVLRRVSSPRGAFSRFTI